ncbi:hypothetical protein KOR34_16910 [Posidoniimonas corsicana]|uniref:Tetratricopeptide repeat protein n=1 Tax=Posidoniimonas corsicana TaxID=1938618 RepID=A0A5C5VF83_9BACT|nr:hypothetical protein [Posidoniimonas corsicana]TWT36751.1 hypothetical protein KOR34_16910 [Posidoniimonas corsicana]
MISHTLKKLFAKDAAILRIRFGVAATLGLWAAPVSLPAQTPTKAPLIVERVVEDSVLVATRQALEEGYDTPEGALEPIAPQSEHQPEPADPPSAVVPPRDAVEVSDLGDELASEDQATVSDAAAPRPIVAPGDVAAALLQEDQRVAAAPFKQIVAGESSRQDLVQLWGQPSDSRKTPSGEVLTYQQERFTAVEVLIEEGRVELIKAQLEKQSQPERLAAKLRVDSIDPVTITDDESGEVLGIAYPEKGLMFLLTTPAEGLTPLTPQFVTHIVLQAPDAEAFALRAETRPRHSYTKRLSDLSQALIIKPDAAYSLWLRSDVFLSTGQPVKAEADAKLALDQEEDNAAYRLRWCETLAAVARYDDAVLETRKVIDNQDAPELVKAQALALMGRLASLGDAQIADKAIGFHTSAISIADRLATSKDATERRAAKQLLVDSHLAVAVEVSRRSYDDKSDVVAQWIGRASGLAEELITNDKGSLELRLKVARVALETLANLKPTKDPGPWITEASDAATSIVASTDDQLLKHQAHWELGQAYFNALRVSHTRREADRALAYGDKAISHLTEAAETADAQPEAERLIGRLYFHLGAANAVHKQDHAAAVEWYDQAQDLLLSDAPESELVVPRQLGEALVSMGVSYWNQGQQDKAVELTVQGSEIMQQAVEAKVLDPGAMAVPFGNLSTMHRKLGDTGESAKYAALAAEARDASSENSESVANRRSNGTQRSASTTNRDRTASRPNGNGQNNGGQNNSGNRRTMLR